MNTLDKVGVIRSKADTIGNLVQNVFNATLEDIGKDYIHDFKVIEIHKTVGIGVGANIDKRNVAMSILAKEMGTNNNIAYCELANVRIEGQEKEEQKEDGKDKKKDKKKEQQEQQGEDGILMEWIEGKDIDGLRRMIGRGEIECDNDAEIIEQLSDIQVTDYLFGNRDRHMKNVKIELEKTGRKNGDGQDTYRIKRIVGIDNDMGGGLLKAEDIKDMIVRLTPPEQIKVISRTTANNIRPEIYRDTLTVYPAKSRDWR